MASLLAPVGKQHADEFFATEPPTLLLRLQMELMADEMALSSVITVKRLHVFLKETVKATR